MGSKKHVSHFFVFPVSAVGFSLKNLGLVSSCAMTLFISILGQLKLAGGPTWRLCHCLGRKLFLCTYVIGDVPLKSVTYRMSEMSLCTCVRRVMQCAGGCGKSHTLITSGAVSDLRHMAVRVTSNTYCDHKYIRTPLIRINWDGEPSGYAGNTDNWIFSFKICYIGSLKFGCYYLQYAPASKRFDHA